MTALQLESVPIILDVLLDFAFLILPDVSFCQKCFWLGRLAIELNERTKPIFQNVLLKLCKSSEWSV